MAYTISYMICLWLLSIAISGTSADASYYYLFSSGSLCTGRIVQYGGSEVTLKPCPNPFFSGYGFDFAESEEAPIVTKPASVQKIDIKWFLNNGNPALNISFKARVPDSPQVYELNVLADESYNTPIFCGHLQTSKPNTGRTQMVQLGVEMRCPDRQLKANVGLSVAVEVTGSPTTTFPKRKRIDLPGCDNRAMSLSNECKEMEKRKIQFSLHQDGNATVVVLVMKTAYLTASEESMVYLSIRQRKKGVLGSWETFGEPLKLNWPRRTARFGDLTPGKTYSVVAWRPGDYIRNSERITIKSDIKTKRYARGLMRRLAARNARRA